MPKLDGTGPMGRGQGNGRGMENCGGGEFRQGGCGRLGGFGFGMGRRFYSPKNELIALQEDERLLKEELQAVQEKIEAVRTQK